MKTTHTPGPLVIVPNQGNEGETICIQTEQGKVVAEVWVHFESQESEAMQYAKLFAAAPNLLEALKVANTAFNDHFSITDSDEGGNKAHDVIREAIKKATS